MFWKKKSVSAKADEEKLPHEYFPPITFSAAGADNSAQQANLIQARQSPAFTHAMALAAEALVRRCDSIMLDFTREAVTVNFSIDGLWVAMPPRDRPTGDAMLACFKQLANLNVAERRAKQEAKFGAEFQGNKYNVFFLSQGVPTGERVNIKILPKKAKFARLEELGMRDKMIEQYKQLINRDTGLVILSAPPGNGLTTLWNVGLQGADRFVRDFVSVEDKRSTDEEIINVNQVKFDGAAGETPDTALPKMLLKQPDVVVLPEPTNAESLRLALEYAERDEKMVITRASAKEAVEAILRIAQLKGPIDLIAKQLTMVVNMRLIRKLCECKQAYEPPPQLLQKLGIPAGRVQVLYREWQPPPPDPNAKKQEEPQICQKCNGVGYLGRTGIFEMLVMNDQLRDALVKTPKLEILRQIARQTGNRTIQEEGILMVAKGDTSIQELQRVLK